MVRRGVCTTIGPVPRPTIRDVARAAGVHPGTASRALNPALAGRITAETTRRVEEAAAQLGYVPDQIGRSLRTNRSLMVGVLVPDLGNPVFPPIVRGIEDTLRSAGYEALIANTDDSPEREERLIDLLRGRSCDGFVIASSRYDAPAVMSLAESAPVVVVNRLVDAAVSSVSSDDRNGMAQAVSHLVALGHVDIAHVTGPEHLSMTAVRRTAFEDAMRNAGLSVDAGLVTAAERYTADEGEAAFAGILHRRLPTAVVAGNDMIAIGCYAALRRRELRCPTDVSVIGYNDMPLSGFFDPPLTTIAIPQYDIGAAAAELVLRRIGDGRSEPERRLLPTALILRGSTAPRS